LLAKVIVFCQPGSTGFDVKRRVARGARCCQLIIGAIKQVAIGKPSKAGPMAGAGSRFRQRRRQGAHIKQAMRWRGGNHQLPVPRPANALND
jgi:hypothetical protein